MALFDYNKYTPEQAASLINIPGKSLADTNTPQQIAAVQQSPGVITPASLTNTQPFPLVSPSPTPTIDVAGLTVPTLALTPQEQKQSATQNLLADLYGQQVGKSSYQAEQESKFGVNQAQQALNDNTAQLIALQKEAAAIPSVLQQNSQGVTTAVIDAKQRALQNDVAIKALGVSALTAGLQNNVANAKYYADKAVAAKYDPIQEKIDALKANLQTIIDDPETSLEDKNRAAKQQAIQDAKSQQVAQDKQTATEVWKVATDAASNVSDFKPTTDYKTAAQALDGISKAKTKEEALRIAVQTGMVKQTTVAPKILGSASSGYFSYDPNTGISTPLKGSTPNSPNPSPNPKPQSFNSKATSLQKQAIPTKALNSNGTIASAYKKSLIDKGLPTAQIDWLWNAVTKGTSFEEIRQAIRNGNGDPKVLDTFVSTLQK